MTQQNIFLSILSGLRFDLYVMGVFLMPLQLFLLIPIKSKNFIQAHFILSMLIIILLVLFSCGDTVYFSFFNEHLTAGRLLQFLSEIKFFTKAAISEYLPAAIIVIFFLGAGLLLGVKIVGRIIRPEKRNPDRNILYLLSQLILILITIVFIRSINPDDKITDIIKESSEKTEKSSLIAVNGVFTMLESLRKTQN